MIRIEQLHKRYGAIQVLRGIDTVVPAGQVTGLVGPNAAGKTTLIKSILGLTRADHGVIEVAGTRVNGDESYRKQIGYMPQIARFPAHLTGRELLTMLQDLRAAPDGLDTELIERFELEPQLSRKLNDLSGGTKQKFNAVAAFLFKPPILILDEPTAGLDPRSATILKDKILADRATGRTFLITSHVMSELEELADNVMFISDGRVRFSGSIGQIKDLTRQVNLERAVAELMERGVAA